MMKPALQILFEQGIRDLIRHTSPSCPNCKEQYELFTTSGVLPELDNCQTGRCKKCNTDFYYKKCLCWFECFTLEQLSDTIKKNQGDFGV